MLGLSRYILERSRSSFDDVSDPFAHGRSRRARRGRRGGGASKGQGASCGGGGGDGRRAETRAAPCAACGDPYEGRASFHRRSKCKLTIHLKDDRLSVEVDGHMGPENLAVSRMERGAIFLGSSWQGEAWSQRNLADDVYDGVFKKVRVLQETGQATDEEQVIYSSEYTGMEKMQHRAKEIWESVLRWFLDYV